MCEEIDLSELNDDESRETKLPEKLMYNPDLVKVTTESFIMPSNIHTCTSTTVTVEPLKYDIRSLIEYGYVMAHLLVRLYEISERKGSDDEFTYGNRYRLNCTGKLPSNLYRKLNAIKLIEPKNTKEPFDIMGIQVFSNEGNALYPSAVYGYKLNRGYYLSEHYLPVGQKASVADIVRELLKYITAVTINLLGYEPDFGDKQMNKLYTYEED